MMISWTGYSNKINFKVDEPVKKFSVSRERAIELLEFERKYLLLLDNYKKMESNTDLIIKKNIDLRKKYIDIEDQLINKYNSQIVKLRLYNRIILTTSLFSLSFSVGISAGFITFAILNYTNLIYNKI